MHCFLFEDVALFDDCVVRVSRRSLFLSFTLQLRSRWLSSRRFVVEFRTFMSAPVGFSWLWLSFGRCSLAARMSFYDTLPRSAILIFSLCSSAEPLETFNLKRKEEDFLLSLTMRTTCDHCQFIVSLPRMALVAHLPSLAYWAHFIAGFLPWLSDNSKSFKDWRILGRPAAAEASLEKAPRGLPTPRRIIKERKTILPLPNTARGTRNFASDFICLFVVFA